MIYIYRVRLFAMVLSSTEAKADKQQPRQVLKVAIAMRAATKAIKATIATLQVIGKPKEEPINAVMLVLVIILMTFPRRIVSLVEPLRLKIELKKGSIVLEIRKAEAQKIAP